MTYSIWLVPNHTDAKYLNSIISALAKQHDAPKFSAHITLFSGITSLAKAKSAVTLVKSKPIKIRNTGIGQSDYLWKTLFVKIKKEKPLLTVQKTIRYNVGSKYSFSPHLSLIYKKFDRAAKNRIRSNLRIKKTYTFDAITIIQSSQSVKKWKKLYTVRLGITRRA